MAKIIYCPNCGHKLIEAAIYCPSCGSKVSGNKSHRYVKKQEKYPKAKNFI
ncbi:MAG: zinc-ribbon domain-containing protein [Melioribacteraceae bacterium]